MELPIHTYIHTYINFLIHTSTFLAIISVASQLLLCFFWISPWLGIGVYKTLA
jgi:hypothetical protein